MAQLALNRSLFQIIFGGLFASILEWYDFSVYIYLTPILATIFFPHSSRYISTLLAYSVFALGYLARPIGAALYGHYGDRIGRKKTLTNSMKLMSFATVLVGFLPTYDTIGLWAPILLVLLRMIQGLSTAGGVVAAVTFTFESSPPRHRGLMTTFVWIFSNLGIWFATLIIAYLSARLSVMQMQSWGWRIPFFLGIISLVATYTIRHNTRESVYFSAMAARGEILHSPIKTILKKYKKPFFKIVLLFIPSAFNYFLFFVFLPTYSSNFAGHSLSGAMFTNAITMSYLFVLTPIFSFLSDRIGRKPFLIVGLLAYSVFSAFFFRIILLGTMTNFFLVQSVFALIHAVYACAVLSTSMESLPTRIRFSAIGIAYNTTYAIIGGATPLFATYIMHKKTLAIEPTYFIIAIVLAVLFMVIAMRETYKNVIM